MDELTRPVFEALDALGIVYAAYEHPAVFSSEDAATYWRDIPGTPVKNLFLRNKKGDRHYLVILGIEKRADLRELVRIIGDDRFSFGSAERLGEKLGLTPGSVSPFGLLHPGSRDVQVIIDEELRGAERLLFHPNINTATVTISFADLERFLASRGNAVRYIHVDRAA
ncbi:MAG TPA: prolyl-tRNA synthetase associated domain-containing protein [Vicinamibacterales bacterium]|nr:prolyl-tRNA synthetase associated domain-containing protein [Vicinamibacterales bacterium]